MATISSKAASSRHHPGLIAGVAAAGVIAGLAVNFGRKLAVQSVTAMAGEWIEALAAEHRATLEIFDALEQTDETQKPRRTTLLAQLKHALVKHAVQEENVIYPAMRQHGLTDAADGLNHDHGYVKQFLFELTELPRSSPEWHSKLVAFRREIERHMREEEEVLFPRLRAQLSQEASDHLTIAMNKEGFKAA